MDARQKVAMQYALERFAADEDFFCGEEIATYDIDLLVALFNDTHELHYIIFSPTEIGQVEERWRLYYIACRRGRARLTLAFTRENFLRLFAPRGPTCTSGRNFFVREPTEEINAMHKSLATRRCLPPKGPRGTDWTFMDLALDSTKAIIADVVDKACAKAAIRELDTGRGASHTTSITLTS